MITQEDISKILGCTRTAYSLWEMNKNTIPLYYLNKISNEFNINIVYLVDITDNKEVQINKKTDSEYKMGFYGCNFDSGPNKFVFTYELESCGSGCWSDQLIYTYDIKTGNFTSKIEKTESTSYTE